MDVSLDGKVALVTGAGPNIGSGIALALSRYGARVACNDLDPSAAKAAVRRIERNGGVAMALSGDVSVEADVLANIGAVLQAWDRIDIVINNAAWLHARGLLEEDLASFNRAITIAVNGNFLFTKHGALAMIERGIKGSVVSILSSNAWQGAPGFIAYATHKGGLANFVRAAAMDLAPYGIRVNSFTPTAPRPDNPELLAQWRAEGGPGRHPGRGGGDVQPAGAGVRWAVHLGGVGLGDTVLILGAGQRGLAAVLASRAAGAGTIIVTGLARDAGKLALAREFGADVTIDVEAEDTVTRVLEVTGGVGADVALELTPMAAQPIRDALHAVRWGGRVVLAGLKGGQPAELSTELIINKALTVVGAFSVDSRGYAEAIRLIETGRFPLARMHTHTFGLSEVGLAIETLAGEVPGQDAVHVAIVPGR